MKKYPFLPELFLWSAYILAMIVVIMLTGCTTQRRCNDKFPQVSSTAIRDSIVITHETRFKDSIIFQIVKIPKYEVRDSVVIRYQGEILEKLYLAGRYSSVWCWVENSFLKGKLTEGGYIELESKIKVQQDVITKLQNSSSETVKVVTEYRTKPFVKYLAWFGGSVLILLILYVAYRIVKVYFKFTNPFLKI